MFCRINLLFFSPCSPARSFDPLLDHPLDDSLTAKEIKYIGLTTTPLTHLPPIRRHSLPPSLLISFLPSSPRPLFLQQISSRSASLSFRSHRYPFSLPSFLCLCFFFLLLLLLLPPSLCAPGLIPASQWMHVRDVIPLFNMLFRAPTPPQTQSLPGLHAYSSALKNKRQITLFVMYHNRRYSILSPLCRFWWISAC